MNVENMASFIVKCGGADLLAYELAEMAIQDEFTGLDNRLARELRSSEEKPIKVESVPHRFEYDELSGDYYDDKAIFHADGSVDVVTYKGEGVAFFSTAEEYQQYVHDIMNPEQYSERDEWEDYENYELDYSQDSGSLESDQHCDSMEKACRSAENE